MELRVYGNMLRKMASCVLNVGFELSGRCLSRVESTIFVFVRFLELWCTDCELFVYDIRSFLIWSTCSLEFVDVYLRVALYRGDSKSVFVGAEGSEYIRLKDV